MKRYPFALLILTACGGEATSPSASQPVTPAQVEMPITGSQVAGLGAFEQSVRGLLEKYKIPGATVAIVREGKLFYARGFGYADAENKTPMQPDALFRVASVSKTLTSAAIMTLVEEGRLSLDDRVAPFIAHLAPAPGATIDPRWEQVTIQHLLNHTGGWDRDKPNGGFDPIDRPLVAAAAVNAPAPASSETLVRYMKGMPLDFNPGDKFAYSNFGFILLGRVIERVTGMRYEDYVRTRVLQPVGANRTRQGKSLMRYALPEEVKYYFPGSGVNFPLVQSVFPGEGAVPVNYGGFTLEVGDASGAWVSSAIDLLRFLNGVDGRPSPPDILGPSMVSEMTSHGPMTCGDGSCYYADGWWVRPVQGDATWWHGGDNPGAKSFLVRSYNGFSWVALFNASAPNSLINELDVALWNSLGKMTSFPSNDLFSTFR